MYRHFFLQLKNILVKNKHFFFFITKAIYTLSLNVLMNIISKSYFIIILLVVSSCCTCTDLVNLTTFYW